MARVVGDVGDLMTIAEWKGAVDAGAFNEYDGSGCWVKDGEYMHPDRVFDDVFGPVPEGATHVEWFNK